MSLSPATTLLLFNFLLLFAHFSAAVDDDQLQPLLRFKSALQNSRTADVFKSWASSSTSVCNFTGVLCNGGRITEINLPNQNLAGILPLDDLCSALPSLRTISLGGNSLHGSISPGLNNCTNLEVLDLGLNSFTGQFPEFSGLRKLRLLDVNKTGLSGEFPWTSLANLSNLEFLSLGDNLFDEMSRFPDEILKLNRLTWLYLTNCSIKGRIPDGISNLTLLQNLELSDNQLYGEIPPGIAKLTSLWQLELYNNSLSGKLPDGFGNLTNLVNFDASTNMLEGELHELKPLTKLASLQLFENQFSGEIPEEIGQLKGLTEISLYRNKLVGSIPQKIGSWADFSYIDVSENFLTGQIPPDMCKRGQMTDLLVLQNNLTGEIPASYADCKSLVRLRVNNNSLTGSVPAGIWGLPNISVIDLSMNQFEGSVTDEIGLAKSLGLFNLANNRFSGNLPAAISQASSLVSVWLSFNRFTGGIPERIGELKKLSSFYLDGNTFSGTIPASLGSCVSLSDINFSGNSLSGDIPEGLGSLKNMNSLNLSSNKLSGEIPICLSSIRLSNLDLSNNQLIGPIPSSLSLEAFREGFKGNPGLCSETLNDFHRCSSRSAKSGHLRVFLWCFTAAMLVLVIAICLFLLSMNLRSQEKIPLGCVLKHGSSWNMKSFRVLSFRESDIITAIKSENLIGKGGSGNVYKAVIGNGSKQVAVKHIWMTGRGGSCRSSSAILAKDKRKLWSPEFEAEVATLSTVRHVNVVKLYCSITSEDSNLLVYEYLPNGSLWDRLHSSSSDKVVMDWELRYAIALGSARGLEYLHHCFDRPVIHRDVKSSNILLDEEWNPRIADFGLAKILHGSPVDNHWSHGIAGTHGYMAPEYGYTTKINEKSDVYSFGVVLMELVTGKRPIHEPEFGDKKDIVEWVYNKLMTSKESSVGSIVDSNISDSLKEDAVRVLKIAVRCTANIPTSRPTMRMVVHMLEEAQPPLGLGLSGVVVVGKEGEKTSFSSSNPQSPLPPSSFNPLQLCVDDVVMAPKRGVKAPALTKKKPEKVSNPLFEKRPKQFGIGGALPPKRDLTRFVKWPHVVRIQRQRRILKQRLKVPPAVNQFTKALDKNLATQMFKLLLKYRPEDKAAKKERLVVKAKAEAEGKTVESKKPIVVKYGLNHVTYLIEQNKAQLVIIAHDVDPIELVVWLPALCRKMEVPYAIVKGKSRLGAIVHQKTAAALCLTSVKNEDKMEFSKILEAVKANFNDKFDEHRKRWGGGIMGSKSQAKTKAKERLLAKEAAQRMS
ncbi:Receptor-like protein kinase 7 [Linum grandiflorum]